MIKPIFTEKSLQLAKNGKYSFWVDMSLTKPEIKAIISRVFGVHVTGIRTIVGKGENKRNLKGRKFSLKPTKKAVVALKGDEKIDVFEESKKK